MKVLLIILDGWGISPVSHGNLVYETKTPGWDTLLSLGRATLLRTASLEVGLPWGSVGDSELGHYNLGTGRIIVRRGNATPTLEQVLEREALLSADLPLLDDQIRYRRLIRRPQMLKTPVSLSSLLAAAGLSQIKCAVSDKETTLTKAMNGFPQTPLTGETFVAIPHEQKFTEFLTRGPDWFAFDLVVINLSLADRAAHSGNLSETHQAIVQTDTNLIELIGLAANHQAVVYVTADHGNIEQMLDTYDHPDPNHTTNPVCLLRVDFRRQSAPLSWHENRKLKMMLATQTPTGLLADITPTILSEFAIPAPAEMAGISLLPLLRSR